MSAEDTIIRKTQKVGDIELPPPMDVVIKFFGSIFTLFLKNTASLLAAPITSSK